MTGISPDAGSFRDPAGQIFHLNQRVYRTVSQSFRAEYEYVRSTGLVDALVKSELLVAETPVKSELLGEQGRDAAYVLEHPRLPFISYPYEWGFEQLKAAALLHLDVQIEALKFDVSLSDSTAYNVQFVGSRPVFIDHLSFTQYTEGEYWAGHGQFCQQFLNPLLLRAYLGIPHNAWYRGNQEGIPLEDISRIIPRKRKYLSWNTLAHITLQSWFQARAQNRNLASQAKSRKLPKTAYVNMLSSLRDWISGLTPHDTDVSVWGEYATQHSYSDKEVIAKREFVGEMIQTTTPSVVWDLGCNTGDYSELALQSGAEYVIGFDFDQQALDKAYVRSERGNLAYLPLYFDATNPSPSQGWSQSERQGLWERRNADGVLALALIHHLAISKNIPLDRAVEWIMGIAPQGVIEFVPKSDPMVQELLSLRADIFPDYNLDAFLQSVNRYGRVIKQSTVSESGRVLVWFTCD